MLPMCRAVCSRDVQPKVTVTPPSSTGRPLWVLYPDQLSVATFTFDLLTTFWVSPSSVFQIIFDPFRVMWKDSSLPFLDRSILVDFNTSSENWIEKPQTTPWTCMPQWQVSLSSIIGLHHWPLIDECHRVFDFSQIYSHSTKCAEISWRSSSSMVILLAFVNGIHQWPVIRWFLPCSTSRHCNHMARIISYVGVLTTLACLIKSALHRLHWNLSDS